MPADNYKEILEEVSGKLDKLGSVKELDVINIKNSVESIENLVTDTQAKLNFQEIKDKLEDIAFQVGSCSDTLLKDLYNDIDYLKKSAGEAGKNLENLQNLQNTALTSTEFEEYQRQQLDLALKTNENLFNELSEIKEVSKTLTSSNNIQILESQLQNLHNSLAEHIGRIAEEIRNVPTVDAIGSIMSDLNSVQQKNIRQTNVLLKELQARISLLQKDIDAKDFEKQIAKISEIYDSLNIIHSWIEKVGDINKSIENVYSRFGENIDFDDVSDKVDIIYENVTALNNWTIKIDNADASLSQIREQVNSLNSLITRTESIKETLDLIKTRFDSDPPENLDIEDIINKADIIYENLTALNDWVKKIDKIADDISSESGSINKISDNIETVSDNITGINGNIINLADDITNLSNDVDNITGDITNIAGGITNLSADVESLSSRVEDINNIFENDLISSKIDLIYENIALLNEWIGKIDKLSEQSGEFGAKYDSLNAKIDEITKTLISAEDLIKNVPDIKDKLEDLSNRLHIITGAEKDENADIYTLSDIESDFLKLSKSLDDSAKTTSQDIIALKERFSELNDDISSISIRTNKLLLSADDANKEFKTYLESFKDTIQKLDEQSRLYNPDLKITLLGEKTDKMINLAKKSVIASTNLNRAFVYLAEWIDASGAVLNSMRQDLNELSNKAHVNFSREEIQSEILKVINKVDGLESAINNNGSENISELKNLLTAIVVQLDTALTPDIDSLNERIDKLAEENRQKISGLEKLMQETITKQAKQINDLDQKIGTLSGKFDKVIEVLADDHNGYEIKDILNYITAQISTANENISKVQNFDSLINELSAKAASFDANTDKIFSYIEENKSKEQNAASQINEISAKIAGFDAYINKISAYIEENKSKEQNAASQINELSAKIASFDANISKALAYVGKNLSKAQNSEALINELSAKIASFDADINKIVSYIEED